MPASYEQATLVGDDDLIDFHSDSDEPNEPTSGGCEADTPSTSNLVPMKPGECCGFHYAAFANLSMEATKYVNPFALTRELYDLKQTTSVEEYAEIVEAYIKKLNYPMSMAVGYFRNGLRAEIAERLDNSSITNVFDYSEIKANAVRIEGELEEATPSSSPSTDARSVTVPDVVPGSVPKDEKEATSELMRLIPASFKKTPGLTKPLLWHAAIKYIDNLTGSSTLTPFDVFENPQPLTEYKEMTRTILQRMLPTQYHPCDVSLEVEPLRYIAQGAISLIKKYPKDKNIYTVSKRARKLNVKMQEELQNALEARQASARKIANPRSQKKIQPAPTPAVKQPASREAPQGIGLRTRSAKALRSDPVAKARQDVRRELNRTTATTVNWDDSGSVIAYTKQRIADLTRTLDHLKAAVPKSQEK